MTQFNHVPQAQPKRKARKWPWIAGAAVVLVGIAGMNDGSDDDGTPPKSTAKMEWADHDSTVAPVPIEPAKALLPGMHAPVRDGKFEFVVTDVQTGLTSLGDNPYLTTEAQGQFVVVTMTVNNTSKEPKGLSPDNQELFDAQGRKFTSDAKAALNLESDVPIWDEINPGNTVTVKIAYDMPADAVPAEMELHDSMFSGGVRVALR